MNERELLLQLSAGPQSGDTLARASGHSRAAVWKRIDALRAAGVAIDARPGRGYALAQPLELLDRATILAQLPPAIRAWIAALDIAWSLDSTNSELLRRPTPVQGANVLLAERQSAGRGRRSRDWASPLAANLYLSVARVFSGGLARLPGLSVVAGIAVAEALHALGCSGVRLKWPNDLVVDAHDGGLRKLGGLLIEGGGEHAGPVHAVLGLGLNVRMPAAFGAGIGQPWTDLARVMGDGLPSRNRLASTVLAQLLAALDAFDAAGLPAFLPRYRRLDALTGRAVTIRTGDDVQDGHALGIADDGALRVRIGARERRIHAGEVSVRAA